MAERSDQLSDRSIEVRQAATVELAFGTTWVNVPQPALEIGPATIETRETWAARLHIRGKISQITLKRLRKFWAGEKPKVRKLGWDQHAERLALS